MLESILDGLIGLSWFLIALGVLVFVHELGHFLVAKRAGIRVERFSLGYPPKMVGFVRGETEYCISWIPFGGYVKVAGMADVGSEESRGEPWEFPSKSLPVRMAVIAAGPLMNFVFAFAVFVVVYGGFGMETVESTLIDPAEGSVAAAAGLRHADLIRAVDGKAVSNAHELVEGLKRASISGAVLSVERGGGLVEVELPAEPAGAYGLTVMLPPRVGSTDPGTPAAALGLQRGDLITGVDGQPVATWSGMREVISVHPGEAIELQWQRGGRAMTAMITPEERLEGDKPIGIIGIRHHQSGSVSIGWWEAVKIGAWSVYSSSSLILDFLGSIFEDRRYKELGGPIRIAIMADDTADMGLRYFLQFLALLSVNLAVLNLLPIPVLDGGHLTFLTLEAILRRPPSVRQREVAQQVGLVIILFIMVMVTFNDLNQFVLNPVLELFQ